MYLAGRGDISDNSLREIFRKRIQTKASTASLADFELGKREVCPLRFPIR